jgi:hypothetical protein
MSSPSSPTQNDTQWRSGVIEITRTSGQGVGTTYHQVVAGPGGRRISADIEITEFVADEHIAFRTTSGPVRPTGSYDLRAQDGGTNVTFHLAATLLGLKKLMTPMVRKTMKREVTELTKLKHALESP